MTSVVFFKTEEGTVLEGLRPEISVKFVEVLKHDTSRFAEQLRTRLAELDSTFLGVILPSPRAVAALAHVLPSVNASIREVLLIQVSFFAVGPSTAAALTCLGLAPALTGSRGVDSLVDAILEHVAAPSKVLYLCGDNEKSLPRDKLAERSVEVVQCVCYTTVGVEKDELEKEMRGVEVPRACVFFSPSGVETVWKCAEVWPWQDIHLLAIGTTTATTLAEIFGRCDGVPTQFNLIGLVALLNQKYAS